MNSLQIAMTIVFSISILLNILFYWYIRKTTSRLLFISENLNDLVTLIEVYRNHLKSVYEMEMFYGDETLANLINHTRSLYNVLDDYEDIVYLTEPIEPQQTEDKINDNEETEDDESPSEKDVFYAGTRRRNS